MSGRRAAARVAGLCAAAWLLAAPAALAQRPAPPPQPQDTTRPLTPRERALERLRALPSTPVVRDTTPADTLAADTLAADTAARAGEEPGLRPAAPPQQPLAHDSIGLLLRRLPGYRVTEYEGQDAVFDVGRNRLELRGESRVAREGNALATDSVLIYSGATGVVCGYGTPVLTGSRSPVESRLVCYDIDRQTGMAVGARTQFTQGATWYVRGEDNRIYTVTTDRLYAEHTDFTSCDLEVPHYHFSAARLKMVSDNVMVARNVTLNFADVPVFWLPFLVQSLKPDRRSGLLMPEVGVNDIVRNQDSYQRHISNLGFYWAINDYLGARVTGEWYSQNWVGLQGQLSFRWLRQFLNGYLTVQQLWQENGGENLRLNSSSSWQPSERTRASLSANYSSSSRFLRRNSFDPEELNRQIRSNASVNRRFDWGTATLGASRTQHLTDEKIEATLPSLSVSLSPVTLLSLRGADGVGTDLTWSGSGRAERRIVDVDPLTGVGRDTEARTASANSSLSFGKLSWAQSASYSDDILDAVPAVDTLPPLPESSTERLTWSTSLSYLQVLRPGTSLTPSVSVQGQELRPADRGDFVAAPMRVSAGASLGTTVYGFWPGFGPFSRIRHKISPSLSYSFAPSPTVTDLQREVFGVDELSEQNRIALRFNQTFEAKYAEADTAPADTLEGDAAGEPRRLPQARKVMLLSVTTSPALQYDFVRARETGVGFVTEQLTNHLRSDLVQGFDLRFTHDLFRPPEDPTAPVARRTFDPHLRTLDASFSIDSDWWLFRLLGLGVAAPTQPDTAEDDVDMKVPGELEPPDELRGPGPGPRAGGGRPIGPSGVGGFSARLNYSLIRPRLGAAGLDNQMLRGSMSFRPTQNWSATWSTSYSITDGEFGDHSITLRRDLHRWQASFRFMKAQNGNFALSFRVNLIDNEYLKLDYDQRTRLRSGTPGGS